MWQPFKRHDPLIQIRLRFFKSLVGVVHHCDEEVEEDDDVDEGVAAEHEEAEEARELLGCNSIGHVGFRVGFWDMFRGNLGKNLQYYVGYKFIHVSKFET